MNQYQYLLLLGACVAITLPLELVLRARVYRRPRPLLTTLLVVVVVFGLWDLVGIAREHWTYNPEFFTGVALGPLPIEELAFFLVIPVCGLLSYEAVDTVLRAVRNRWGARRGAPAPPVERTEAR